MVTGNYLQKGQNATKATRNLRGDPFQDLVGTTYIVTGANSGIGLETARQLVKPGAHVVMAYRRTEAGEQAARSIADLNDTHEVMRLDLADLASVREFADAFTAQHDRLDGLACNAGMVNMRGDLERTKDGVAISYEQVGLEHPSSTDYRHP